MAEYRCPCCGAELPAELVRSMAAAVMGEAGGRIGGRIGGRVKSAAKLASASANIAKGRMKAAEALARLTPEERSARARKAVMARWGKRKQE